MTFKRRMNSMKNEFLINRQASNFYGTPRIVEIRDFWSMKFGA